MMRIFVAACVLAHWFVPAWAQPPAAPPVGPLPLPFVAMGNEPGWRVDITADLITLMADNGATKLSMRLRRPEPVPGGRRYAGNADGRVLVVTVVDRVCEDDMTGMPRPNTVTVTLDEDALRGCGGDPAALLRGAPWVVAAISGTGTVDRSRVTIAFGDDGRVTGGTSCNSYTAAYALTGEGLAIQQTAATQKACAPALMRQEQLFLAVLGAVARFAIEPDGALVLHAADGRTIRARRAG